MWTARLSHAFGAELSTVEFLPIPLVGNLQDGSHRAMIFASIREPRASNPPVRQARESSPVESHRHDSRPGKSVLEPRRPHDPFRPQGTHNAKTCLHAPRAAARAVLVARRGNCGTELRRSASLSGRQDDRRARLLPQRRSANEVSGAPGTTHYAAEQL